MKWQTKIHLFFHSCEFRQLKNDKKWNWKMEGILPAEGGRIRGRKCDNHSTVCVLTAPTFRSSVSYFIVYDNHTDSSAFSIFEAIFFLTLRTFFPTRLRRPWHAPTHFWNPTLASTRMEASLHFKSLIIDEVESSATAFETSTIMRTVGNVVCKFCGCGGRIQTGTRPANSI